ncbi:MAG: A/G-specific adenine glycosylase [Nitrospiria bacterium]
MKASPNPRMAVDRKVYKAFTTSLLRWYRAAGRDLPWRYTSDPYAVWVSEIMLQQTQVATALPYYRRFLTVFPTVEALAAAPLERVLKIWQGLGYYARVRHLHRAAQLVVRQYRGEIPADFKTLQVLPGIGRSTAGAILTIAFGQRYPILDGNVRRVLCRFFAIRKDPKEKPVNDWLWTCSEALLPKRAPGLFLQAIMDLGATVCKPVKPLCDQCPVQKGCRADQEGIQALIPLKRTAKAIPHFDYMAGVIVHKGEVLIHRRPLKGLLAGLWEFPGGRLKPDRGQASLNTPGKAAMRLFLKKELNMNCSVTQSWMTVQHAFTHFRMTLHVFKGCSKDKSALPPSFKWAPCTSLGDYPFSAAHQKIVLKLTE